MSDFKCPFCGSDKLKIETGYLTKFGDKEFTYCCPAQATNHKYINKSFTQDSRPDPEDITKW